MKVTQVGYKRLWSFGRFENATIEAVATVDAGELPEAALAQLTEWVTQRIEERSREYDDWVRERRATGELADLERRVEEARAKYERVVTWMNQFGIAVPAAMLDDVPF